jgi:hypothetical protein
MPHTPGPVRAFSPPWRALAATALTALTLTSCGIAKSDGPQGEPSGVADSKVSVTPSTSELSAFMAMLDKVAQPCSSTGGTASTSGPADKTPTGPEEEQSLPPGATPPTEPIEPDAPTEPGTKLSDRDRCASVQHEQRIIEALQMVPEPTPTKVRKALNNLGYIDERIHDLKQDGKVTRFYLDLREKGGQLCEEGLAAGKATDVTACTAPATGAFTVHLAPS